MAELCLSPGRLSLRLGVAGQGLSSCPLPVGLLGGGAGQGRGCLALRPPRLAVFVVACDTLFVVATVATVASHLGGPAIWAQC